jgi:hypothetical protein
MAKPEDSRKARMNEEIGRLQQEVEGEVEG